MKCPHCNYEHGYNANIMDNVEGEHGEFFELKEYLTKDNFPYAKKTVSLFGCPECCKTFIKMY